MHPTTIEAPARTQAQRLAALESANRVRSTRARFKLDVKRGAVSAADALLDPPDWLESAKVLELLLAVPKVGRVKATRVLNLARVSPSKSVGGLTARQRAELLALLRPYLRGVRHG